MCVDNFRGLLLIEKDDTVVAASAAAATIESFVMVDNCLLAGMLWWLVFERARASEEVCHIMVNQHLTSPPRVVFIHGKGRKGAK